eukprot:Em0002g471a
MEAVQGLRKARFERETWTYFALLYLHNGRGTTPMPAHQSVKLSTRDHMFHLYKLLPDLISQWYRNIPSCIKSMWGHMRLQFHLVGFIYSAQTLDQACTDLPLLMFRYYRDVCTSINLEVEAVMAVNLDINIPSVSSNGAKE